MQFFINKVTLVGNICHTIKLEHTKNGTAVVKLSLATNRGVKNAETDSWDSVPTFHNVICWQKLAENVAKNYVKGDKIYVDGRIENRSYEDKEGVRKYVSEVIAEDVIGFNPGTVKQAAKALGAEETAEEDWTQPTQQNEDASDDVPF